MTMTRSGQDERFEVSEVSRRGAHRSRPNPLTGVLPLVALAAVVLAVVGLAYFLFGRGSAVTTADGTPGVASSAAPSAASPAASAPASASPEPSAGTETAAAIDKTVTLNFYNGTSPQVPGQSRKAASKLAADGWKIGTVLPWDGAPVTRTTVYYGEAAQLPTARAVVKALGGGTVKLNTIKTAQGMAVVIGNDYTP